MIDPIEQPFDDIVVLLLEEARGGGRAVWAADEVVVECREYGEPVGVQSLLSLKHQGASASTRNPHGFRVDAMRFFS